jgi:hypothetical protein
VGREDRQTRSAGQFGQPSLDAARLRQEAGAKQAAQSDAVRVPMKAPEHEAGALAPVVAT